MPNDPSDACATYHVSQVRWGHESQRQQRSSPVLFQTFSSCVYFQPSSHPSFLSLPIVFCRWLKRKQGKFTIDEAVSSWVNVFTCRKPFSQLRVNACFAFLPGHVVLFAPFAGIFQVKTHKRRQSDTLSLSWVREICIFVSPAVSSTLVSGTFQTFSLVLFFSFPIFLLPV